MAYKAEVKGGESSRRVYPWVGLGKESGAVVVFTRPHYGTLVKIGDVHHDHNRAVGKSESWNEVQFESCTITLSNDG